METKACIILLLLILLPSTNAILSVSDKADIETINENVCNDIANKVNDYTDKTLEFYNKEFMYELVSNRDIFLSTVQDIIRNSIMLVIVGILGVTLVISGILNYWGTRKQSQIIYYLTEHQKKQSERIDKLEDKSK